MANRANRSADLCSEGPGPAPAEPHRPRPTPTSQWPAKHTKRSDCFHLPRSARSEPRSSPPGRAGPRASSYFMSRAGRDPRHHLRGARHAARGTARHAPRAAPRAPTVRLESARFSDRSLAVTPRGHYLLVAPTGEPCPSTIRGAQCRGIKGQPKASPPGAWCLLFNFGCVWLAFKPFTCRNSL